MPSDNTCVIIPTYNNSGTILNVIQDVLRFTHHLYVVCDGTTDGTESKVREKYIEDKRVTILGYSKNKGKGYALMQGFKAAAKDGFTYAVTIDSDGQHLPDDIPSFIQTAEMHPGYVIIGTRQECAGQSSGSRFANHFSNFWFAVQTWQNLPDTQSGFRLYPLACVSKLNLVSTRYEAELEILVRMVWKGIRITAIPINVYYPPAEERVSHFRKGKDFIRISILNTILTIFAFTFGYPSMLFRKLSER